MHAVIDVFVSVMASDGIKRILFPVVIVIGKLIGEGVHRRVERPVICPLIEEREKIICLPETISAMLEDRILSQEAHASEIMSGVHGGIDPFQFRVVAGCVNVIQMLTAYPHETVLFAGFDEDEVSLRLIGHIEHVTARKVGDGIGDGVFE